MEQKEVEKTYKFERKVTLTFQSNNLSNLTKLSNSYFSKKVPTAINDPEDLDNYVCISRVKE